MERRLAAILSADAVGYSRLMAADETATIRTLNAYRDAATELIQKHRGRLVDAPGDNFLAEFPSALEAVRCAVEFQQKLRESNAELASDRKMEFRIGVHLGDVSVDRGRIYGDGVNIAARLEALAAAGGLCISGAVHDQVRARLDCPFEDLGEQDVKNIPYLVRVYRVQLGTSFDPEPAVTGLTASFEDRPAIAVLPFANLSGDPDQEYFADGLAEDLITLLSTSRLFPVIARNSSFVYKGNAVDVKRVSQELGARYVVEGSVRKAGNRVRATAQLIDAATGHHVWAERYDRELEDVFAVQDEIAEAIVAAMHPELQHFEIQRAGREPPRNLDAWECLQRGSWHFFHLTKEENAAARAFFEQAIEYDPDFAPAYSALARAHQYDVLYGWSEASERSVADGLAAAERAAALAPKDPSGQISLGFSYGLMGQREKAISAMEAAVRINPSSVDAYFNLAFQLALAGRGKEGLAPVETALRLSPKHPELWLILLTASFAHFGAAEYEEAADYARQSIQRRPDRGGVGYALLAACYGLLGRVEEARLAHAEQERVTVVASPIATFAMMQPDPEFMERFREGLRIAGSEE